MELVKRETCQEYFERRLREGWKCISLEGYNAVLLSPDGIRRELDLRNDVETLRPSGGSFATFGYYDGSYHGGLREENWKQVDEVTADDDATFVYQAITAWSEDHYTFPAHSDGSGTINNIKVYCRMVGLGGTEQSKCLAYVNSVLYYGDVETLTTSWASYSKTWTKNPNTGLDWTWDNIDALIIGVALNNNNGTVAKCTQVYVEVDYTASGATSIKTVLGVPIADIKTIMGVPIANVKSFLGVSNVS